MALTEAAMKALIDLMIIETDKLVQIIITDKLGLNEITDQPLLTGTTTIVFGTAYQTGEDWSFLKKVAISDDGDYDIGCVITNPTITGFDVTVTEACKFSYRTSYLRTWIPT